MRKKYNTEFKREVVERYLRGEASQRALCREYQLSDKKLIRVWVKKYQNPQEPPFRVRTKFKDDKDQLKYALLENEFLKKN